MHAITAIRRSGPLYHPKASKHGFLVASINHPKGLIEKSVSDFNIAHNTSYFHPNVLHKHCFQYPG